MALQDEKVKVTVNQGASWLYNGVLYSGGDVVEVPKMVADQYSALFEGTQAKGSPVKKTPSE